MPLNASEIDTLLNWAILLNWEKKMLFASLWTMINVRTTLLSSQISVLWHFFLFCDFSSKTWNFSFFSCIPAIACGSKEKPRHQHIWTDLVVWIMQILGTFPYPFRTQYYWFQHSWWTCTDIGVFPIPFVGWSRTENVQFIKSSFPNYDWISSSLFHHKIKGN